MTKNSNQGGGGPALSLGHIVFFFFLSFSSIARIDFGESSRKKKQIVDHVDLQYTSAGLQALNDQ